ncbi:CDC45 family protein [Megaselia abdita]
MFIQNFKSGFYDLLVGKQVLIIVNYDIDAICASKILQNLFQSNNTMYSVVPIMGIAGLKRVYRQYREDLKYVILLNCGGCVDIVDLLQPEEDVTFFICDSHRPFDVCNVYSDTQVCILAQHSLEEKIPQFEEIFRESDGEDELSDDDNDSDESAKNQTSRLEKQEKKILKQRERRHWQNERDRLMFEYNQYSYYGRCSALMVFELAWKLSKDSIDLVWLAIVGITEQLLLGKIESSTYTLEIDVIQGHVSRLTNKSTDQNQPSVSKIVFENDLHLALYRHWSVIESMRNSMYCACKLKLWTLKGDKKLHELLVEMGLPLVQAKQTYSSMDLVLRKEFYQMISKLAEKYDIPDIVFGSFAFHFGYRNKFSASDYVYGSIALLESVKKNKSPEDCFSECLASLTKSKKDALNTGIDSAKLLLSTIFKQVQSSIEANQVKSAGPFLYFILNEENPFFSFPYGLKLLAKFILNAYVAVARNRKVIEQPLVVCCPIDFENGLGLLVGIPPYCEESPKNFFGKAFEQAAVQSNSLILQDSFESSLIQIRLSDMTKFLDALTIVLS